MSTDLDTLLEEQVEDAFTEPVPCEGWDDVEVRRFLGLIKTTEHYDCDEDAAALVTYLCTCGCGHAEPDTVALCAEHIAEWEDAAKHDEVEIISVVPIGGAA